MIFNVIKLKLNDINLSIYALEIVFETIFHGNGRNSDLRKGVSLLRKGHNVSGLFFFLINLFDLFDLKIIVSKQIFSVQKYNPKKHLCTIHYI